MASKDGIIEIALSNTYYYNEAQTDDFLIHPYTGTQNLILGTSNIARIHIAPSNLTLTGPVNVTGNFLPSSNLVYDLGSSNLRWRDIYLSGNTIDLGGTKISTDTSNNVVLRDSTTSNLRRIIVNELQIGEDTSNSSAIVIKRNEATSNVQFFTVSGGTETSVDVRTQWSNVGNTVFVMGSNVAIGKSNAAFTLDVGGNINFTGDLYKNSNLYVSSQWSNLPGCNLAYTQGGIGIGTTTVTQALTVQGGLALRRSGLITSSSNIVGFSGTGVGTTVSSQWSNVSSNVFLIGSNVGIGTSNPQSTLHVVGDINFTGTMRQNGIPLASNASLPYAVLYGTGDSVTIAANSKIPFNKVLVDTTSSWNTSNYNYTVPETGRYLINMTTYVNSSTNAGNRVFLTTNGTTQAIIVGFGTATELAYCGSVTRAFNAGDVVDFRVWQQAAMFFTSNSPNYYHSSASIARIPDATGASALNAIINTAGQFLPSSNDSVALPTYTWAGDSNTGMYHDSMGRIGFASRGSQVMALSNTGVVFNTNVGIGTSNPQVALHVAAGGDILLPRRDFARYDSAKPSSGTSYALTYATAGYNNLTGYITYSVDATNGDSFVILVPGVYSIVAQAANTASSSTYSIDRNTPATALNGGSSNGNLLAMSCKGVNSEHGIQYSGFLGSNDVVRVKVSTIASMTAMAASAIFITMIYRCG